MAVMLDVLLAEQRGDMWVVCLAGKTVDWTVDQLVVVLYLTIPDQACKGNKNLVRIGTILLTDIKKSNLRQKCQPKGQLQHRK